MLAHCLQAFLPFPQKITFVVLGVKRGPAFVPHLPRRVMRIPKPSQDSAGHQCTPDCALLWNVAHL